MTYTVHSELEGFLRLSQILKLLPISKSTWWAGIKEGRFPKPLKLGPNTTVWKAKDIAALIEQIEQSESTEENL